MKPINVIFDHQIFSAQPYGGVSRYFYELLKNFETRDGIRSRVVAPLHCNQYLSELDGIAGLQLRAFPKIYRVIQPINNVLSAPLIRRYKPDLMHETYYQYASLAPASCPVVVTAHDVIHEKFHKDFRVRDATTLRKRAALRRAAHVIAVSESTRRDYIEFFNVPPEKISTVHLGCSFALQASMPAESRAHFGRPYILYVGARKGYKNFESALRAYANSPGLAGSFSLLCFGGGSFSGKERDLIASVLKGGQGEVLHRSGSDQVLKNFYAAASVFIYPSLYEGFGLPPLEAMANGCPVVATDRSSVPEVVGNAALLCNPESVDDIRQALETVLGSSEVSTQLALRGQQRVREMTWENCAARTLDVYRKVLG